MRLSRTDLVPMMAIVAGGALGALASASLAVWSPTDDVPATAPVAVPPATAESATRLGLLISESLLGPADAIRRVEALQRLQREVQRDVRLLVTELGAERTRQIERLLDRKDHMHEAVLNLEREWDRSASMEPLDNLEAGSVVSAC